MKLLKTGLVSGLVVLLSLSIGPLAAAEDYGPLTVQQTEAGKVLADPEGMTVYTFDKDEPGKSNCTGQCAEAWPPVTAEEDAEPTGALTIITREDGSKQWAYEDQPLYTFVQDQEPGDVEGDGFKDIWHVVEVE